MIITLTTLFALAGPWSDDPSSPSDGWLTQGAQAMTQAHGDRCSLQPRSPAVPLPAGVRVRVWLADIAECDRPMLWASFDGESWPRDSTRERFWIDASSVSAKPPRNNVWSKADPITADQFLGYVHMQRGWVIAQALDSPGQPLTVFGAGDKVQVLAQGEIGVFRLHDGRTFAVPGQRLRGTRDPLGRTPVTRRLRDRLLAGREKVGEEHPIDIWPNEGLGDLASRRGHTFVLRVDGDDLTNAQFHDDWLDPVGHVMSAECDERSDPAEPCTPVYLDYTELGAWWPVKQSVVLARLRGTKTIDGVRLPHLLVVVKDPFGTKLKISPGFDGKTIDQSELSP